MGRIVIGCFRPFPGREAQSRTLTETHVERLPDLGLATNRPAIAFETVRGDVAEAFEWVSAEAIARAHEHPDVLAMFAEYEECCVYVPVREVAGADLLFPDYTPLPTARS